MSSTSYNLRNKITTGGTYYVKVQARGSGIASDYSDPITYVLSLAAPVISLNQNTLSWDAVTDATSYYVYKNGLSGLLHHLHHESCRILIGWWNILNNNESI